VFGDRGIFLRRLRHFSVSKIEIFPQIQKKVYKMNDYVSIGQTRTVTERDDPITMEEFKYDENAHPRAVIMIRRSNGVPYPYHTTTVMELINRRMRDPFNQQPFSNIAKERVKLYMESIEKFPTYINRTLNTTEILNRWLSIQTDTTLSEEQKALIRLEARCFLQPSDLLGLFEQYQGKGSAENRQKAEDEINSGARTWVLRNSSLTDTEYNKAYVLSYSHVPVRETYENEQTTIQHSLIIHKVGEGFYLGVGGISRNGSAGDVMTGYNAVYPTIVQLLEACGEV
jgi:hypothetical protein